MSGILLQWIVLVDVGAGVWGVAGWGRVPPHPFWSITSYHIIHCTLRNKFSAVYVSCLTLYYPLGIFLLPVQLLNNMSVIDFIFICFFRINITCINI